MKMLNQNKSIFVFLMLSLILCGFFFIRACAETSTNVMYYFIGGDLESDSGAASRDIKELLRTEPPSGTHVFIATGGSSSGHLTGLWQDAPTVSEILNAQLIPVGTLPRKSMGTSCSLTVFLDLCHSTRPADRHLLILWGHGTGYSIGYDQLFENDELELSEIAEGIRNSNLDVDLMGFDACNMATEEMWDSLQSLGCGILASSNSESLQGWPNHLWLQYANLPIDTLAVKIADIVNTETAREGRPADVVFFK